jgi:hypothetical protein
MFVAITDDTPRNGSGSTTSNGVCSTGAKTAAGRGARGGASGEIGSLIDDLPLLETPLSVFGFNFVAATAGIGLLSSAYSGDSLKLGLINSPVGSVFGEPTGL